MTVVYGGQSESVGDLQFIRDKSGVMGCRTNGLSDDVIDKFSKLDPKLRQAIEEAKVTFSRLIDEFGLEILQMEETSLIAHLQTAYVNFYSPTTINPYVCNFSLWALDYYFKGCGYSR